VDAEKVCKGASGETTKRKKSRYEEKEKGLMEGGNSDTGLNWQGISQATQVH